MSPTDHPVNGSALLFSLASEVAALRGELAAGGARAARTLVKEGPLRVTLVGINPGGELRMHRADGPISVHVLEGAIAFQAGGEEWTLAAGALLSLPARVDHAVRAPEGGIFLLTVAIAATG